jgi:tetratricopeptide (TPR) repeat protein
MVEPRPRNTRRGATHRGPPGGRTPSERGKLALWQAVVTPLIAIAVFFGLLEGVLALAGVEPVLRSEDPFVGFVSNVPLFVETTDANGRKILNTADNKLTFFNRQQFPREKAPGTYRIFCLGGSTTYGRPYQDTTSFAGWLREQLPVADPRRRWEVINAGGISYASYRVAHLMQELAHYEPDLFIIYSGHNEFLEERTYGTLRDVPLAIKSTVAWLARTRTWAALSSLLRRPGPVSGSESDGPARLPGEVNTILDRSVGPELYERDDALRDQILLHYRVSLERMVEIAKSVGADIIFVTPASNLKDCTPFKSQHTDGLAEADALHSEELLATALERIRDSAWSEALEAVDEALAIDPRFAELHYRRGRVLLALGRHEEAGEAFRRARDEDVCPLRALSPIRETLAGVARKKGATLVDFVDLVEQRVLAEQGNRIPGEEYFLDHLHPTIAGNRLLAVALLRAMIEKGIVQPADSWGERAMADVASRVEASLDREAHAQALANLARVLVWAGKVEDAQRLARRALDEAPEIAASHADILAKLSERQGETAQGRQYLRSALNADPGNPEIHLQIGLQLLDRSNPGWNLEAAAAHILLASVFSPENDMTHQIFGLIMAERRRYAVAYPSLLEALRLNPRNVEAERALARLRELLGPDARGDPPKVTLERYPSGAPRQVVQVRPDATGRYVAHGISTGWYESGELERFLDYADGVPHGTELTWAPSGRVTSRAEYRHGTRTPASARERAGGE